jgi:2-(1,2-epoxy-1,2-dihydrophenyl)acetyl-CoA isomerase
MPIVEVADSGHFVLLPLNRPEKRNALNLPLVLALSEAIEEAPERFTDASAIVITGAGSAFCSGGDLPELSAVAATGALEVTTVIYSHFHRLVRAVSKAPLPVIAAVNGPALGAGFDLALVCDLRVASDEAVFASSWIGAGLIPGMGGALWLTRMLGASRAADLVLTGRRVAAREALELGLVRDVTAAGDLASAAAALAQEMAALPRTALALSKAALRRSLDTTAESELAVLAGQQGGLLTAPEFAQRMTKFRR